MKNKLSPILRYAAFGCGILAGLFGLLAGFLQFDAGTHYFVRGAIFPILTIVFALLGAACAISSVFFKTASEQKKPCRSAFLLPAAGFIASSLVVFFLKKEPEKVSLRLAIASAILLALSAIYCILFVFLKDPRHQGLLALFGFAPLLSPALLAFFYYFDKTVEMNSPLKTSLQTGLLFCMILFLCEVRLLLGRPLPRLLLGLRLAFFPVSAVGVGMILATYFSGAFQRTDYLLGALLLLSLQVILFFDLIPSGKRNNI